MQKVSFSKLSWTVVVSVLCGCGGAQSGAGARMRAGTMPAGGDFDGVYSSPFGRMELSVQGNGVVGLYEDDQHSGRIEGALNGDLLHFTWTQWNQEMRGKIRETKGRGVFRYIVTDAKTHKLEGTWGYERSESGNKWEAWKMLRGKKKLKPFEAEKSEMMTPQDDGTGFETAEPQTEMTPEKEKEPVKREEKKNDGLDLF